MTPPCPISGGELSRYFDREITAARSAELEKHVESCDSCRLRLADVSALGRLMGERRLQLEREIPMGFAASVMGRLPLAEPRRGLMASLQALLPPRRQLTFGLIGLAVAASLAIVFAPSLRSHDDHLEETTENEAQIHSLEVSSPDRSAIVFDSADGNTVIWMVPSTEENGAQIAAPDHP